MRQCVLHRISAIDVCSVAFEIFADVYTYIVIPYLIEIIIINGGSIVEFSGLQ